MARSPLTATAILAAAADLADREGFDAIAMSTLARLLGVQTASLYGHVRDRAAVLEGVQELALHELADEISAAVAGRSGLDALGALSQAHRTYAMRSPGRWDALQRPATPSTARSEAASRVADLSVAVFRGYALSGDDLVHATRMLGSLVNGFIALERAGSLSHRAPHPDESWQRAMAAMDSVVLSWAPSTNAGEVP